jgi:hypothetical protein
VLFAKNLLSSYAAPLDRFSAIWRAGRKSTIGEMRFARKIGIGHLSERARGSRLLSGYLNRWGFECGKEVVFFGE